MCYAITITELLDFNVQTKMKIKIYEKVEGGALNNGPFFAEMRRITLDPGSVLYSLSLSQDDGNNLGHHSFI